MISYFNKKKMDNKNMYKMIDIFYIPYTEKIPDTC